MPVELNALPEELAAPDTPSLKRWALIGVPLSAALSALIVVLWPEGPWHSSLWFWCCVAIAPLLGVIALCALGWLSHERQRDFVDTWNLQRAQRQAVLIEEGQRSIALLASSYCTPAGNEHLAQALATGARPFQSHYSAPCHGNAYLGQLEPHCSDCTDEEYCRRLQDPLGQVMQRVLPAIHGLKSPAPVAVRIRHDGAINDQAVLAAWRNAGGADASMGPPELAADCDGLLWLDAWLDQPHGAAAVLSVEINLFKRPVPGQSESISAVLLAQAHAVERWPWQPLAWVHRPVGVNQLGRGLEDALLWGQVLPSEPRPFTWHTHVERGFLRDLTVAMAASATPFDLARCRSLDDCFGFPGAGAGNIALIVASEQARDNGEPQLVLLHDSSTQACVVRAA